MRLRRARRAPAIALVLKTVRIVRRQHGLGSGLLTTGFFNAGPINKCDALDSRHKMVGRSVKAGCQ